MLFVSIAWCLLVLHHVTVSFVCDSANFDFCDATLFFLCIIPLFLFVVSGSVCLHCICTTLSLCCAVPFLFFHCVTPFFLFALQASCFCNTILAPHHTTLFLWYVTIFCIAFALSFCAMGFLFLQCHSCAASHCSFFFEVFNLVFLHCIVPLFLFAVQHSFCFCNTLHSVFSLLHTALSFCGMGLCVFALHLCCLFFLLHCTLSVFSWCHTALFCSVGFCFCNAILALYHTALPFLWYITMWFCITFVLHLLFAVQHSFCFCNVVLFAFSPLFLFAVWMPFCITFVPLFLLLCCVLILFLQDSAFLFFHCVMPLFLFAVPAYCF